IFSTVRGPPMSPLYACTTLFRSSTSLEVTHTVGAAGTTTTITADTPEPSVVGQPVSVSYTVTSAGGTPTGNVTVSDGTETCVGKIGGASGSTTPTTAAGMPPAAT